MEDWQIAAVLIGLVFIALALAQTTIAIWREW